MTGQVKKYRCIVADPPWDYPQPPACSRKASWVRMQYKTMATEDICQLPVQEFADPESCHLWLWTTTRHLLLGDAMRVCKAWGFAPKQLVTWCKTTCEGEPAMGLGYYLRCATEYVILATLGKAYGQKASDIVTWFTAPRRRHSEKPQAFYDIARRVSPGPYLDIFARDYRDGWDVLGDELVLDLFAEPVEWP